MCKIWTKNSQPLGKNVRQPPGGGGFFDSQCITVSYADMSCHMTDVSSGPDA